MTIEAIANELSRIEESATYGCQAQFEQAKLWRIATLIFGVPAAVLAAVAGATGFADVVGSTTSAAMALAAAACGAVATTLGGSKRAEEARLAGNGYLGIRNAARRLREIDLPSAAPAEAREELRKLCGVEEEVNKLAPLPSRFAFFLARRNIAAGHTAFEVDR